MKLEVARRNYFSSKIILERIRVSATSYNAQCGHTNELKNCASLHVPVTLLNVFIIFCALLLLKITWLLFKNLMGSGRNFSFFLNKIL